MENAVWKAEFKCRAASRSAMFVMEGSVAAIPRVHVFGFVGLGILGNAGCRL